MNSYFGAPRTRIKGSISKPPVIKVPKQKPTKIHKTLIFNSYSENPVTKNNEERVYRTFFVSPHTNMAVEDPANHLEWRFYPQRDQDPRDQLLPRLTQGTYVPIRVVYRPELKADVIAIKYDNTMRTVEYASLNPLTGKPIFFIRVYDPQTGKSTKKLYGDVNYYLSGTTPPGSPRNSQFGKTVKKSKKNNFTLKRLKSDLRRLMKL
jgi:hypothetical protein